MSKVRILIQMLLVLTSFFIVQYSVCLPSSESSLSTSNVTTTTEPSYKISKIKFPIKDMYQRADAFNIEGARAAQALDKKSIWVNLAMILDRPLIEGVTLDEITKKNSYPLKEMSIENYNETNVNLSLLLITNYYINWGHALLEKTSDQPLKMMIQVHRNSSGIKMIDHIANLLTGCLTQKIIMTKDENGLPTLHFPDRNAILVFRKGSKPLQNYKGVDILFSVSLLGGLNPKLTTGALTIPKTFIPFDINTYELALNKKYKAVNHLHQDLYQILSQPQEIYFYKLNTLFKSLNSNKKFLARKLNLKDFQPVTLLQIEENFYPKDPEKMVLIK